MYKNLKLEPSNCYWNWYTNNSTNNKRDGVNCCCTQPYTKSQKRWRDCLGTRLILSALKIDFAASFECQELQKKSGSIKCSDAEAQSSGWQIHRSILLFRPDFLMFPKMMEGHWIATFLLSKTTPFCIRFTAVDSFNLILSYFKMFYERIVDWVSCSFIDWRKSQ